jgi:hypothetical protein
VIAFDALKRSDVVILPLPCRIAAEDPGAQPDRIVSRRALRAISRPTGLGFAGDPMTQDTRQLFTAR